MFARCCRIAKHVFIPMALLAVLAFSTGVAAAHPARHRAHHKVVRHKSQAAAVSSAKKGSSSKQAASSAKKGSSSKKGSHGGSTGGSKGSKGKGSKGKGSKGKGSKGSTGGSGGPSGGSGGGSGEGGSTEGSSGGSEGSTGEGSTGGSEESAGGSGGSTGGSEGSTGGGSGGSTGGSGGSTGGSGGSTGGSGGSTGGSGGSTGGKWVMPQHLTWYWQIQGTVNNSEPVAAYDIDGFDNTAAEVAALHAQGKHVICYVDVGTAENFRPDYSAFPVSALGSSNGWPGEKWLDIRQLGALEPLMIKRFDICKEKGFDAVEPDNMDGYSNSTGFPLTAAEQLTYNEWVATEVHSLGMAVLQKNDGEQAAQLEPYFDGALDEQCNEYSECSSFQAYLSAGKPVLNAEYGLATSAFCAPDNSTGIMGARFGLELNGTTFEHCWS
jgi:hypothetical protein